MLGPKGERDLSSGDVVREINCGPVQFVLGVTYVTADRPVGATADPAVTLPECDPDVGNTQAVRRGEKVPIDIADIKRGHPPGGIGDDLEHLCPSNRLGSRVLVPGGLPRQLRSKEARCQTDHDENPDSLNHGRRAERHHLELR